MAKPTEVYLPDIGDFQEVDVIEVLVSPGEDIVAEQSLITLESDKATMEIPSPTAGRVQALKVGVGDKINQGALIALVEVPEDRPADQTEEPAPPATSEQAPTPARESPSDVPDAESQTQPEAEPATDIVEVNLPDIGDFQDVEIIEILVKLGDQVAAEQSVLTLESDKATMEIPAPFAGEIREIKVAVGERINQGQAILSMAVPGTATAPAGATADGKDEQVLARPAPDTAAAVATPTAPIPSVRAPGEKLPKSRPVIARPSDAPKGKAHASPAVRRFARELGVELLQVAGTAPKGRVTKDDVQNFVKQALAGGREVSPVSALPNAPVFQLPTVPSIDFSKFGATEEVELGRIKQISGEHLHRSWMTVPHVTQFEEADITALEAFRKEQNTRASVQDVKLTFMPFLLKAVAAGLREYPQFNASLAADGKRLIMKKYIHIGVAVDTPNGLVVPVLRDVDQQGLFDLAGTLGQLSEKARQGKLAPGDMQGGCISISSLGGIGGTQFSPIVNAPEVAIIGVSKATMRPVWNGEAFSPRLILPFSLAYDHRVIDGAEGVRFADYLAGLLSDIRRLLL